MADLDREGVFRAKPMKYGIVKSKQTLEDGTPSKSVGIRIDFLCLEKLDGEDWIPWREYDQYVSGISWIIKKDDRPHDRAVETLASVFGWSGNLESWSEPGRQLPDCQITVEEGDAYKGQRQFRVQWINAYDYVQTKRTMESSEVSKLTAVHGSALRAIAGNAKRPSNVPPPPSTELPGTGPGEEPPVIDPATGKPIPF